MDTPTTETQATPETAQEAPQKNWSKIASEAFGNSYHGEVIESQEAAQESLEQSLEVDDAELSTETEQQEASEAETQQEETPISSFSELIDHYQLDPEWLDSLELGVKVNGQEGKAKFADIKNSYQTMQAAEQRLSDAKERARTELQAVAEKREQINSTFAVTASLVENLEKKIVGDESKINWEKLRNDDPAEWTAKRADFAERRQEVEKIKQDAVSSYQSNQSQIAQESEQAQQQYLQEQQQMLMPGRTIPQQTVVEQVENLSLSALIRNAKSRQAINNKTAK